MKNFIITFIWEDARLSYFSQGLDALDALAQFFKSKTYSIGQKLDFVWATEMRIRQA